jgi:hypothetical protein
MKFSLANLFGIFVAHLFLLTICLGQFFTPVFHSVWTLTEQPIADLKMCRTISVIICFIREACHQVISSGITCWSCCYDFSVGVALMWRLFDYNLKAMD